MRGDKGGSSAVIKKLTLPALAVLVFISAFGVVPSQATGQRVALDGFSYTWNVPANFSYGLIDPNAGQTYNFVAEDVQWNGVVVREDNVEGVIQRREETIDLQVGQEIAYDGVGGKIQGFGVAVAPSNASEFSSCFPKWRQEVNCPFMGNDTSVGNSGADVTLDLVKNYPPTSQRSSYKLIPFITVRFGDVQENNTGLFYIVGLSNNTSSHFNIEWRDTEGQHDSRREPVPEKQTILQRQVERYGDASNPISGDQAYKTTKAEWSTSNYLVNPRFNGGIAMQVNVKWTGTLTGRNESGELRRGESILLSSSGDRDNVGRIEKFYYGVVPASEQPSDWRCDGYLIDRCEFQFREDTPNPYTGTTEIPVTTFGQTPSERLSSGSHRFRIVPLVGLASVPDIIANDNSNFFTITFDESVPLEEGVRAVGTVSGTAAGQDTDRSAWDNALSAILLTVVNIILTFILTILRGILWIIESAIILPVTTALLSTGNALDASNPPPFVYSGWVYVRDVMNLLFILVLIFGGVATMLRIQGYGLKKLIGHTVMIALIVNFSYLLGQIVLNFAQILMVTFLNPETVSEIAQGVSVDWDGLISLEGVLTGHGALNGTIMLAFAIVYEIGIVIVLGALAILLFIRVVGVWLLLIIAPGAYILYLTEQGRGMFKRWWDKFLAYAFFAPFMAFIIAITHKFITANPITVDAGTLTEAATKAAQGVIVIVMLGFGLRLAGKMGIAGADMVTKNAERLWKGASAWTAGAPYKLGKYGAGAAEKWIAKGAEKKGLEGLGNRLRYAASYLSPTAWKKGYAARKQKQETEAYTVATGQRADVLQRVLTPFARETDFEKKAQLGRTAEARKEILTKNSDELIFEFDRAIKGGDPFEAVAYLKALAQNYDLNEILKAKEHTTDHSGFQDFMDQYFGGIKNFRNEDGSIDKAKSQKVGDALLDENTIGRLGYDLSRDAEEVKHWNYARAYKYIPEERRYEKQDLSRTIGDVGGVKLPTPINEAEAAVIAERLKEDQQRRVNGVNRNGTGGVETTIAGRTVALPWKGHGIAEWATITPTPDTERRITPSFRSNAMLINSIPALRHNKGLWLQQAGVLSAETEGQAAQAKASMAEPLDGWEEAEKKGQVFSMQNVHRLLTDEDFQKELDLSLSYDDLKSDLGKDLGANYAEWLKGQGMEVPAALKPLAPVVPESTRIAESAAKAAGLDPTTHTAEIEKALSEFESGVHSLNSAITKLTPVVGGAQAGQVSGDLVAKVIDKKIKSMDQNVFTGAGLTPLVFKNIIRNAMSSALKNNPLGKGNFNVELRTNLESQLKDKEVSASDIGPIVNEVMTHV